LGQYFGECLVFGWIDFVGIGCDWHLLIKDIFRDKESTAHDCKTGF
jgi:hypothetical protein